MVRRTVDDIDLKSELPAQPTICQGLMLLVRATPLSIVDIAHRIGVDDAQIDGWMMGRTGISARSVEKFMEAYGLQIVRTNPKRWTPFAKWETEKGNTPELK